MGATESATRATPQPEEESDDGSEVQDQLDLLRSGDQADVTLISDDKQFMVHTHIVGARSEVFRAMFYNLKKDRTLVITLHSANIVEILLNYMYSGKVPAMPIETALKVHKAANNYAMDSLKNICKRVVQKKIRETNAITVLTFASQEDATDLKDIAVTYLARRKDYLMSGSWRRYCERFPKLANEVLLEFVRRAP